MILSNDFQSESYKKTIIAKGISFGCYLDSQCSKVLVYLCLCLNNFICIGSIRGVSCVLRTHV